MTWPVDTMGVPAWSHLLHLKPIKFFPHFIRRLCHSWHIIQRRRRPVGKPVRQKSPLGRLISLVFIYFSNFISKAQKLYFRNRLNESFSGNVGNFSFFFYFFRQIAKSDKIFKISSECFLCNYTPILVKFSGNIP